MLCYETCDDPACLCPVCFLQVLEEGGVEREWENCRGNHIIESGTHEVSFMYVAYAQNDQKNNAKVMTAKNPRAIFTLTSSN